MSRYARIVIPSLSYHITQRGNRRQQVFFSAEDYQSYRYLLARSALRHGFRIEAYCLMPNHVHLAGVPQLETSLAETLREAHSSYALHLNHRMGWTGHVWQGRFFSCPMDDSHLYLAARYVELNPVRAGLVRHAADWPWSSARAHLEARDDLLVKGCTLVERFGPWSDVLGEDPTDADCEQLRQHTRLGRLFASPRFIEQLEQQVGRSLVPRPRGRPTKAA